MSVINTFVHFMQSEVSFQSFNFLVSKVYYAENLAMRLLNRF